VPLIEATSGVMKCYSAGLHSEFDKSDPTKGEGVKSGRFHLANGHPMAQARRPAPANTDLPDPCQPEACVQSNRDAYEFVRTSPTISNLAHPHAACPASSTVGWNGYPGTRCLRCGLPATCWCLRA
jgi:hypothetical protein